MKLYSGLVILTATLLMSFGCQKPPEQVQETPVATTDQLVGAWELRAYINSQGARDTVSAEQMLNPSTFKGKSKLQLKITPSFLQIIEGDETTISSISPELEYTFDGKTIVTKDINGPRADYILHSVTPTTLLIQVKGAIGSNARKLEFARIPDLDVATNKVKFEKVSLGLSYSLSKSIFKKIVTFKGGDKGSLSAQPSQEALSKGFERLECGYSAKERQFRIEYGKMSKSEKTVAVSFKLQFERVLFDFSKEKESHGFKDYQDLLPNEIVEYVDSPKNLQIGRGERSSKCTQSLVRMGRIVTVTAKCKDLTAVTVKNDSTKANLNVSAKCVLNFF